MSVAEKVNKLWELLSRSMEDRLLIERIVQLSLLLLLKCSNDQDIAGEARAHQDRRPLQEILNAICSRNNITLYDSTNMPQEILDIVNSIDFRQPQISPVIVQVYKKLLRQLEMSDVLARDIFTPQELINCMIKILDPRLSKTIYDPACGTGSFLLRAYQHIQELHPQQDFQRNMLYGNVLDSIDALFYYTSIALSDKTIGNIACTNILENYPSAFPWQLDCIVTNPPFGTIEDKKVKGNNVLRTSYNEPLMLHHCIEHLSAEGFCVMLVSASALTKASPKVFIEMRERLLRECKVCMVVGLPKETFEPYTSASTCILVFQKAETMQKPISFIADSYATKEILYYVPSHDNVGKRKTCLKQYLESVPSAWKAYRNGEAISPGPTAEHRIEPFDNRTFCENKYSLDIRRSLHVEHEILLLPLEIAGQIETLISRFYSIAHELQAPREFVSRLSESSQELQRVVSNICRKLMNREVEE